LKKLLLILPSALILCFIVGCQDKEAMAELEAMKAQAAVEEQNKEIVKSFLEAWNEGWNNGDFEAAKEFLSPDYKYYTPSNNPKPMSREETIEIGKMSHRAFADISFSIEEIIAKGDRVITRYTLRAVHQGEFMGIPATGKTVEWSGIAISHIENGKIIEDMEEFDALGMMQQLGMELKPKEEEK
jgi:steroid delta-isomerase-like uncharacterized protein